MDTNRYESEDYRVSSVFGRVSGCQRPMPSLYINYYLCHCNGRLHSDARVAPYCTAVVRLHISSVDRFASGMRTLWPSPLSRRPSMNRDSPSFHHLPLFSRQAMYDCRAPTRIPVIRQGLTSNQLLAGRARHLPARKFSCAQRLNAGCLRDFAANAAWFRCSALALWSLCCGRVKISRLTGQWLSL